MELGGLSDYFFTLLGLTVQHQHVRVAQLHQLRQRPGLVRCRHHIVGSCYGYEQGGPLCMFFDVAR